MTDLNQKVEEARNAILQRPCMTGEAWVARLEAAIAARATAPLVEALEELSAAARRCVAYAEGVSPDRISPKCNCAVCDLAATVLRVDATLKEAR